MMKKRFRLVSRIGGPVEPSIGVRLERDEAWLWIHLSPRQIMRSDGKFERVSVRLELSMENEGRLVFKITKILHGEEGEEDGWFDVFTKTLPDHYWNRLETDNYEY